MSFCPAGSVVSVIQPPSTGVYGSHIDIAVSFFFERVKLDGGCGTDIDASSYCLCYD